MGVVLSIQPNLFATIALVAWPLVGLWLFQTKSIVPAILWTILGGQLLLPVGTEIKFEMVPALDKSTIPNLTALVGCMLVGGRALRFRYGFGAAEILLLMLLVGPFITSQLNSDQIVVGGRVLPGVGQYDALSAVVAQFLFLCPFFLGRQFLRDGVATEAILRVLVIAGLLYSLPMLFEIRMSPQLHSWIYGYFPHSFGQQMREGGFRPVVFLGHGLLVAFFIMTTAVAAAAFWRTGTRVVRASSGVVTGYLSGVLVLCKTMGALVYGAAAVFLVRFTKPQVQLGVALVLMTIALLYPILRATDLIPTRSMVDLATSIDAERAESLNFRFDNEDQLLARAWQRFSFGWGRFGRNRIFDDESGKDISVTDGRWIITMGQFGFVGFIAEFGLLALPIVRAASALKFARSKQDEVFIAALALIVAINVVDLLPNSSLSPWTWLIAGALLGRAEELRSLAHQQARQWDSSEGAVGSA